MTYEHRSWLPHPAKDYQYLLSVAPNNCNLSYKSLHVTNYSSAAPMTRVKKTVTLHYTPCLISTANYTSIDVTRVTLYNPLLYSDAADVMGGWGLATHEVSSWESNQYICDLVSRR